MNRGRIARVVGLTLALMVTGTGAASAAAPPPAANASFFKAGAPVFDDRQVGVGCSTFGFCDGVAEDLSRSGTPRYRSTRPGEAVLVTCRSASLLGVVGFFDGGDAVTTGWVSEHAVGVRRDYDSLPTCGGF